MQIKPQFAISDVEEAKAIVRAHPFATFVTSELRATHMPCLVDEDAWAQASISRRSVATERTLGEEYSESGTPRDGVRLRLVVGELYPLLRGQRDPFSPTARDRPNARRPGGGNRPLPAEAAGIRRCSARKGR